ncbi:MAG: glycosyltransferase family 4 protein [Nanoarchaeota archaeon]
MDIVIVTEYFPVSDKVEITGGIETRAFEVAKYLTDDHQVTILTSRPHGSPRESTFCGFKVIRCGKELAYANKGSFVDRLSFITDAIKVGKSLKPDLVDGYNFTTYYPAYCIAKFHKVPAIATYHDVWLGEWIKNTGLFTGVIGEVVERFLLSGHGKRFARFITNSAYTKGKLVKVGVPASKVFPVYSGLDLVHFKKVKAAKEKDPTVIAIGRLVPYKRMDDLIRAIAHVASEIPKVKCVILGCGPEETRLKNLIEELGMEDHVQMITEVVKREETIKLLKSSHVFCLPSIVEGMGLVTIEAIAAGIPYVNSAIPPTVEITKGGKGGLLYEPGNWRELAEKIVILLTDKKIYAKCVGEHDSLIGRFSLDSMCKGIEQVYTGVV